MKAMEKKILEEGKVLPGGILKVGSFLNQQIDTSFLGEMAKEFARLYADAGVNKVLTIESSGIAIAAAVALEMGVPMVFAKKHKSSNVDGKVYTAVVHSYTHGTDYTIVVSSDYLGENDRVLLVDDFLANGKALVGLTELVRQAAPISMLEIFPELSNTPNTAAPEPVIRLVTAPWAFSCLQIAAVSTAPLQCSNALPAAVHIAARSFSRMACSWRSQSG